MKGKRWSRDLTKDEGKANPAEPEQDATPETEKMMTSGEEAITGEKLLVGEREAAPTAATRV